MQETLPGQDKEVLLQELTQTVKKLLELGLSLEEVQTHIAQVYPIWKQLSIDLDANFVPLREGEKNLLQLWQKAHPEITENDLFKALDVLAYRLSGSLSIESIRGQVGKHIALFPERIWGNASANPELGKQIKDKTDVFSQEK